MTEEQKRISKSNNKKAREYFGLKGYGYVLHHVNPDWKAFQVMYKKQHN